ncbi:Annexin B9, partial [Armadillidium vulgare]
MYGLELVEDLKSELGGNFQETVVGLIMTSEEFLVTSLHDSLYIPGTDEKTIIEILCNRSSKELQSFNELYENKYAESLEESLSSNLSGDFQLLMTSLVSEGRDQSQRVDPITARKEAQDLYDAGISSSTGSDEMEFTKILNTRSYPQLQETFKEYERISMEPIEKSINDTTRYFSVKVGDEARHFSVKVDNGTGHFSVKVDDTARYFSVKVDDAARHFSVKVDDTA